MSGDFWRKCSACKKPIAYEAPYYTCSVSTCNRKRTALHFCTVSCWEVHLPVARHRESWADEQTAPSRAQAAQAAREASGDASSRETRAPRRILAPTKPSPRSDAAPEEVLIIASRLKDYVRAISGFNTSDRALEPLSDIVREAVGKAVRNAREEGRKTVLDRDVKTDD